MSNSNDTSQTPVKKKTISNRFVGRFKSTAFFTPKSVGRRTPKSMYECSNICWLDKKFIMELRSTKIIFETAWYSGTPVAHKFGRYPERSKSFMDFTGPHVRLETEYEYIENPKLSPGTRLPLKELIPDHFYCLKTDLLVFFETFSCGFVLEFEDEVQANLDEFCKDIVIFRDENDKIHIETPSKQQDGS